MPWEASLGSDPKRGPRFSEPFWIDCDDEGDEGDEGGRGRASCRIAIAQRQETARGHQSHATGRGMAQHGLEAKR